MSIQSIILSIFCCGSLCTSAQTFQIKGSVQDSSEQALSGATVVLLQAQDSVLQHFVITDDQGSFDFPKVEQGKYLLQVSFLGYRTYSNAFDLQQNMTFDNITLAEENKLLDQVMVEAERIPIVMKKDTIEYNADAFQTKPNAVVEDLLKRLPGVEVDRNGTIRAQGEEVSKVLVDGKEFFGNDASIATQNLPADAIDKVQVFDKKSDIAEFTGVDDGERDKTINLKLKADKKKGYFGTLEAGYGSDNRFATRGNLNRFTPKLQLSAIGRSNNVNEQGFSMMDYIEFMGGIQALAGGNQVLNPQELGIPISPDGRRSDGFVNTNVGGLNLNYELSKKTNLYLNYFYNELQQELDRTANLQNLLGEKTTAKTQRESQQRSKNRNHRLNIELKHKIDSTQDLKWRNDISIINSIVNRHTLSQTFDAKDVFKNGRTTTLQTQNQGINFKSNLIYRKRFSRAGRALTGNFNIETFNRKRNNEVFSVNQFPDFEEELRQDQIAKDNQLNYSGKLTYSEPLGKGKYLQFSYRRQDFREELNKEFFDLLQGQRILNAQLSNVFSKDYIYDQAGLTFQWNQSKSKFSFGLNAQQSNLKGNLLSEQLPIERSFSNLLPNARWQYNFTNSTNLTLHYRSSIQEPSLEQLQPIVDNSNPLSIYVGNPNLRAEMQHKLRTNFFLFDQFSSTNLFAFLDLTYTENKITNSQNIDELLRREISPINVKDDLRVIGNLNFGTPIRKIKTQLNIQSQAFYNRAILFINDLENVVHRWNGTVDISLENRKKEIIDARLGATLGYNITNYEINTALNQSFLNQIYYLDFNWSIGEKWNISTTFDYTVYQADTFNPKTQIPIWQASFSHYFGKQQQFELRLSSFDLLNQNIGINRNSAANFVQTEEVRSLGRYFMLSGVWSLKRFGGKS
ncbi:MAG: TonB-dependent receptor [Bacteroidota bacterium]